MARQSENLVCLPLVCFLTLTYQKLMQTITGNTVRLPISFYGKRVSSHAEACAAIPFTIERDAVSRSSTGKVIPGEIGLFRSDNGANLGIHSPNFTFLQPCDSLRTLEKARELIGGEWVSASHCKGGRMVSGFISLESKITAPKRGDQVGLSVGFFDRFDGGGRTRLQLFANVLACTNGMTRQESLISFSEKHTGSLKDRFAALEYKLLINLQQQIEEMQGVVSALDNAEFTQAEMVNFATRLFPAQDENDVPTRTQNTRDQVIAGFSRGSGNVGRTRWDAFNAVTELLDWQTSFRETEFSREENRFESIVSGHVARTRSRAMEMLLS